MACLGGTWDEPRDWMQRVGTGAVRQSGRICQPYIEGRMPRWTRRQHVARDTRPILCSSCPAYRGLDRDGYTQHTGLDGEDNWTALSIDEWLRWQAAEDAALEDNFGPMAKLIDHLKHEQAAWRIPAFLHEDGHNPENAERMREYRARDPERYRVYQRDLMRRRRAQAAEKRALVTARTHSEIWRSHDTKILHKVVGVLRSQLPHPRARAREGGRATNSLYSPIRICQRDVMRFGDVDRTTARELMRQWITDGRVKLDGHGYMRPVR